MAQSTGSDWSYAAASGGIVSSTAAVSVNAGTTGQRTWLSSCQLMSDQGGTATEFVIRNASNSAVLWRTKLPSSGITFGNSYTFDPPLQSLASSGLEIVALTSSTNAIYFNAQGFVAP
jgi:hypothetical protein